MLTAFLVGGFGLLHCYSMCGGVVGALSMSLAHEVRADRWRLAGFVFLYGIGRITSYTVAGFISGLTGSVLSHLLRPIIGTTLRICTGVLMVVIGAYVAGWLPHLAGFERVGDPLWRKIWPLARSILPVRTPLRAWLAGVFWGWLPCSLVYSMLMLAAISGSPWQGAALLFAFGSGTLPGLWLGGVMANWLIRLRTRYWLSPIAGLILIFSGIVTLWFNSNTNLHKNKHVINYNILFVTT